MTLWILTYLYYSFVYVCKYDFIFLEVVFINIYNRHNNYINPLSVTQTPQLLHI